MNHELKVSKIGARTTEISAREFFIGLAVYEYPDNFTNGNFAHDLAVNPSDGVDFAGPIGCIMRPTEPRRFVLLPFRRHRKTKCGRCVVFYGRILSHKCGGTIAERFCAKSLKEKKFRKMN